MTERAMAATLRALEKDEGGDRRGPKPVEPHSNLNVNQQGLSKKKRNKEQKHYNLRETTRSGRRADHKTGQESRTENNSFIRIN